MKLGFTKYSGCGNDFILIDNRTLFFPFDQQGLIPHLCNRRKGIGADGVVFLENSSLTDYRMRIFNANGSEAEMCGNGIRCLLKFMRQIGLEKKKYAIQCMHQVQQVYWEEDEIAVEMPPPSSIQWNINLPIDERHVQLHYLNTGVPHSVLFFETEDQLASIDMEEFAPLIRHHDTFSPKGTNVNIAAPINQHHSLLAIRTFERGVEGETLACGTGAVATALAAAQHLALKSPIFLKTASTEILTVLFDKEEKIFKNVTLKGPAHLIYEGFICLG